MSKTLRYSPVEGEYAGCCLIDKIVHFSKSENGETTFIHFMNGDKVEVEESINTLEARINSED